MRGSPDLTWFHHLLLLQPPLKHSIAMDATSYPVHEAARDGKPLIVSGLLSENNKLATSKDSDGRTPLHWAVAMNHENIVDLVLPFLKNIDLDDLVDDSGWTPVHIACGVGNISILSKLMAHDPQPDINLATSTGVTGLHVAVSKNHYELVEKLLKDYKALARKRDSRGQTPLHRAGACGSSVAVKALVEAGVNVNATDKDGWTALHHALAEGQGDVAVLLVELGARKDVEGNEGEKPVDVAGEAVRRYFELHVWYTNLDVRSLTQSSWAKGSRHEFEAWRSRAEWLVSGARLETWLRLKTTQGAFWDENWATAEFWARQEIMSYYFIEFQGLVDFKQEIRHLHPHFTRAYKYTNDDIEVGDWSLSSISWFLCSQKPP